MAVFHSFLLFFRRFKLRELYGLHDEDARSGQKLTFVRSLLSNDRKFDVNFEFHSSIAQNSVRWP